MSAHDVLRRLGTRRSGRTASSRPGSSAATPARQPGVARPAHRLLAVYLALATPPLLLPGRPAAWALWLALHALAVVIAWPPAAVRGWLGGLVARWPHATRLLADWYPMLLVPLLYTELAALIPALHGARYHDGLIQEIERRAFGGMPSRELAPALPLRWLSELLHAGYLSYYILIYVPVFVIYARGPRSAAVRTVFSVMLAFVLHYLFFIYFPVQGPRYLYPSPVAPEAVGPVYRLTHLVLEGGASRGAAFPSSHVGVAVAQVLTALRFQRRLAPWLAVPTLLLALGAVYGGYHYATDAVCGALLGAAAVVLAPAAFRALGGEWPGRADAT